MIILNASMEDRNKYLKYFTTQMFILLKNIKFKMIVKMPLAVRHESQNSICKKNTPQEKDSCRAKTKLKNN